MSITILVPVNVDFVDGAQPFQDIGKHQVVRGLPDLKDNQLLVYFEVQRVWIRTPRQRVTRIAFFLIFHLKGISSKGVFLEKRDVQLSINHAKSYTFLEISALLGIPFRYTTLPSPLTQQIQCERSRSLLLLAPFLVGSSEFGVSKPPLNLYFGEPRTTWCFPQTWNNRSPSLKVNLGRSNQ